MLASIRSLLTPIHRQGHRFVAIFFAITVILFMTDFEALAWLAAILTLWCAYFFRDPERTTAVRDGLIVRDRRIYDFTGLLLQIGILKAKPA